MLGVFKNKKMEIGEFAEANRNLLVIVADPKDDTLFVAYNGKFAGGRLKDKSGAKAGAIKEMLSSSTYFQSTMDSLMISLVDLLQLPKLTKGANTFFHFIDGAIFNIAESHRTAQAEKSGHVKSPLQEPDVGRVR